MIRRILLDVDDVLNQFTLYALREVGCVLDTIEDFPGEVGFDIVAAANKLGLTYFSTKADFWQRISRDFWANVPVSPECYWLIELCARFVGRDSVCLLTSPTTQPECLAGKLEWIHRNLPEWLHRQYLIGPVKHFCATGDALLIDDSPHNVNAFRDAGGQAILFPKPWNTESIETQKLAQRYADLGLIREINTSLSLRCCRTERFPSFPAPKKGYCHASAAHLQFRFDFIRRLSMASEWTCGMSGLEACCGMRKRIARPGMG